MAISHCVIDRLDYVEDGSIEDNENEIFGNLDSAYSIESEKVDAELDNVKSEIEAESVQEEACEDQETNVEPETEAESVPEAEEAVPEEASENLGNNVEPETEAESVPEAEEAVPEEASENLGNNVEPETEAESVPEAEEAVPEEASENLGNNVEPETEAESVPEVVAVPEEASGDQDVVNQSKVTNVHQRKCKRGLAKTSESDYLDIPKLDELSASVTNFSNFVEKVATWLDLSAGDKKFFTDIVVELEMEMNKLKQKGYEIRLRQVKDATSTLGFKDYKRIKFEKVVVHALEVNEIYSTLLTFLRTIMKYKEHYTKSNNTAEQTSSDDDAHPERTFNEGACSESTDNSSNYSNTAVVQKEEREPDDVALMRCEKFSSIVNSIPRDSSIDYKICTLLSKMGLEKKSNDLYKNACDIAITALSMESIESIDDVMEKAGMEVSTKRGMRIKIKFSEWINDYNKDNHIRRMKVIAFLRALKAIFTWVINNPSQMYVWGGFLLFASNFYWIQDYSLL